MNTPISQSPKLGYFPMKARFLHRNFSKNSRRRTTSTLPVTIPEEQLALVKFRLLEFCHPSAIQYKSTSSYYNPSVWIPSSTLSTIPGLTRLQILCKTFKWIPPAAFETIWINNNGSPLYVSADIEFLNNFSKEVHYFVGDCKPVPARR